MNDLLPQERPALHRTLPSISQLAIIRALLGIDYRRAPYLTTFPSLVTASQSAAVSGAHLRLTNMQSTQESIVTGAATARIAAAMATVTAGS